MKEDKLELRMYGLVPYNISPIQQGIQFGHAKDEMIFNVMEDMINGNDSSHDAQVWDWLKNWKTYIILNGGTTNKNPERLGTLNIHLETLINNGINVNTFYEPDLGDQLTAVTFIVDERVFNKEKYPEPTEFGYSDPDEPFYDYDEWVEYIGGEKNVFLRYFLSQFKLA